MSSQEKRSRFAEVIGPVTTLEGTILAGVWVDGHTLQFSMSVCRRCLLPSLPAAVSL